MVFVVVLIFLFKKPPSFGFNCLDYQWLLVSVKIIKVCMNLSAENPCPELDLLSSHKRTVQRGVSFQG